jgi:hypothetical protein
MEIQARNVGLILSQIGTLVAPGTVFASNGMPAGLLQDGDFYSQAMIVCKFHLILRRAGCLAVTTTPCAWQRP